MTIRGIVQFGTCRGFSRLKGIFRSGINYQNYEQIVSCTKNKTIGNLPQDILKLIIETNPNNKKEVIQNVQNIFEETAVILSKSEKLQHQAIKRFSPNIKNAVKLIEKLQQGKNDYYTDKIYSEKIIETTLRAEQHMIDKLKTIIPNLGNIKISHIGFGSYGNVFKCEIFDKKGNKIVKDRVIKTFHSDKNFSSLLFGKMHSVLAKFSAKNIERYSAKLGRQIPHEKIEIEKLKFEKLYEMEAQLGEDTIKYSQQLHGAYAEANIAEYIRYMAGHKVGEEQGLILPDMINLGENPFAISQYVSSEFKGVFTPPFNLKRLGLGNTDFNPQNTINGVCIDIGGICPSLNQKQLEEIICSHKSNGAITPDTIIKATMEAIKSCIVGDKTSTRILKQITNTRFNDRERVIKELKREAETTKDMIYKRKILEAIKEIEDKKLVSLTEKKIRYEEDELVPSDAVKNLASLNLEI